MKYSFCKIIFLLFIFFACTPRFSFAAEFIASSSAKNINVHDQFQVDILLDTAGENANALGGTIVYPANLLQLKEIRDGNTLVNFWVDKPTDTPSGIIFSGITPGGYTGQSGLVLSLIFDATAAGNGDIMVTNGQLLRNDGSGSEIPLTVSDLKFSIGTNGQAGGVTIPQIKDNHPPESFVPEIGRDPSLFGGKWFVAFATQDKGSGVDYYAVKESQSQIFNFSKWNVADSPYVLSDQNLHSFIYVKAVDKSGNVRIEKILPLYPLPFYENIDNWFILVVIILFLLCYRTLVWKKHK